MTPTTHHHPPTVVMGSSRRILTDAPKLSTLADLDHDWRLVAFSHGGTIWNGDLDLPEVQKRFRRMINDGRVILITHRGEFGDLLFAKLAEGRHQAEPHSKEVMQ